MSHKKRAVLNLVISLFTQGVIMVLGFVIPKIIMVNYGSDTNGLTGTISQIFAYVALLEAGIGQSTRNALYKYIYDDHIDKDSISKVMTISRLYYRRVTKIYGVCVIGLALVLPLVLQSDIPYSTIFFVTLFEGASGVLSFYFVQNWKMFLAANGKNYIINSIELVFRILMYATKITLALLRVNIAVIQAGYLAVSVINLMLYYFYMRKNYSWIDYKAYSQEVSLNDKNAYVITEVAWTVFSSTDMIVLSIFCSTKLSSVYSVYNLAILAINGLLNAAYSSLSYILGQSFNKNHERYKSVHDSYNSIFMSATTILMSVTVVLLPSFVKIYTKGVTDISYENEWLPLLLCLVQMLSWSRYVAGNLSGVAGYAKNVSRISLAEACMNVVFSVILVNIWGITGVVLATVLALPMKAIYCNWLAEKVILKRKPYKTILIIGANFSVFFGAFIMSKVLVISIDSYAGFIAYGCLFTIGIATITALINCIINKDIPSFLFKDRKRAF